MNQIDIKVTTGDNGFSHMAVFRVNAQYPVLHLCTARGIVNNDRHMGEFNCGRFCTAVYKEVLCVEQVTSVFAFKPHCNLLGGSCPEYIKQDSWCFKSVKKWQTHLSGLTDI